MSKELVAKEKQEVALSSKEIQAMLAEDNGAGLEESVSTDGGRPLLILLQSNTPMVNGGKEVAISGAAAGMFFQMNTGALLDGEKGFLFLPCHYRTRFYQAPYDSQGRTGATTMRHVPDSRGLVYLGQKETRVGNKTLLVLPNAAECVYVVKEWFGFMVDGENTHAVEMRMKSTAVGASDTIYSVHKIKYKGGALFNGIYRISSKHMSAKDNNWKQLTAKWEMDIVEHPMAAKLIVSARALHAEVKSEQGSGTFVDESPDEPC